MIDQINVHLRKCLRCGRVKHPHEFRLRKQSRDGLDTRCRECRQADELLYRINRSGKYDD